jgi:xylulokinase
MKFCGLDVGTTGVKAYVYDEKGALQSKAYRAYDIKVGSDGTRLLSSQELWTKTRDAFAEAANNSGGIDALCASSFGEAFVGVDASGGIVTNPMIFTDRWGEAEYAEAEKKTSAAEISQICGLPLSPTYSLSKLLYLRDEQSALYAKVDKFLLIQDFINFMFSGETGADYSTACRTMFFDIHNYKWSESLMAKFGLDVRHYSKPVPMGTVIGSVKKSLLGELGLSGDIKVVTGGHDQPVNAIGSGLRAGYAVNSMGTSECLTPILDGELPADFIAKRGIPMEPVWEKGKYCCMAYNVCSGLLVQWYSQIIGEEPAVMDKNVPAKPTKIMVQPYLMGSGTPYMDSGARLALAGIDYGAGKYDIYRSILESLVLDQKLNLEILAEQKVHVKNIIAVGGGSKSAPWLQIKADILETPVSVLKVKEAGALGAAILCAKAMKAYSTVEEGAGAMSQIESTIEPDLSNKAFYGDKFSLFKKIHEHVKEESAFALK